MSPGCSHTQELEVKLANGDRVVANSITHKHLSQGLFLLKASGEIQQLHSPSPESTYLLQIKHCHRVLQSLQEGALVQSSEAHSLDNQIELLKMREALIALAS